MNAEKIILDKVEENRQQIIDFVQKIVQIPSLSGEEFEIGQALKKGMEDWGLEDVEVVEKVPKHPNLLARVNGKADGPTLVFNGHMDVIAPGDESQWTYPPYSGAIVDGNLYGRGTVDMKTSTCTMMLASAILKKTNLPLNGNILVTVVCDEEICGDRGILHLLEENKIQGDFGINGEPTNFESVVVAHKGILRAHIHVYGKNAHGSRPYLGHNAIDDMIKVINRIQVLAEQIKKKRHPIIPTGGTIVVATIDGGSAMNMVPDKCTIGVVRRLLPGETREDCIDDYQCILDQLKAEDPEFRGELEVYPQFRPPLDMPTTAPIIQAVQCAHKAVFGEELPMSYKDGGTDASFITEATGMPMPIYGPGDYKKMAALDECIAVEDIVTAVKVYALAAYYGLNGCPQE